MDRPRRSKKTSAEDPQPKPSKEERRRQTCAKYRASIKADPAKYAEFRQKNIELKRLARKNATPEQKLAEREKARLRQAAYRERQKAKTKLAQSAVPNRPMASKSKPPETRGEAKAKELRRLKNRLSQQKRRANMSAQKKRRERERNRTYIADKRQKKKTSTSGITVHGIGNDAETPAVSRTTIHRLKAKLQGKGSKFLISLKGLIKSSAKKNADELKKLGIIYKSPSKISRHPENQTTCINTILKKRRDKSSLTVRRLFSGESSSSLYKRRKFKDGGAAVEFFKERSLHIPGKRWNSSEAGAKKVLDAPVRTLHKEFVKENGPLISQATFFRKRPKNILSYTKTPFRQCLCEICLNPMLLMKAVNKLCSEKVESLRDLIGLTICGENVECMRRKCGRCGVHAIDEFVKNLNEERMVEWQRWEKVCKNGSSRLDLVHHEGTLLDICEILKSDLIKLPLHDFIHRWQSHQYRTVVSDIPTGWAVLTMDFAENYLCRQQDQPQSAYFGYTQVTVHPCVLYYKCTCGLRVTENWTFVSDVLTHSSCMVDVIMRRVVNYICELSSVSKLVIFSDGCSSQYKSKLPFFFLSQYADCGIAIERSFFGSRHGKNPCDALGGLLKQSATRAVQSRRCVIQNANDLFDFARENLEIDGPGCAINKSGHLSRRHFLVKENEISQHDSSGLKTVVGTREIHSLIPTQDGLMTRNLSCFCSSCISSDYSSCLQKTFVNGWQNVTVEKNKVSGPDPAILDTAFLQSPKDSLSLSVNSISETESETCSSRPRDVFFSNALSLFSKCNSFQNLEKAVISLVPTLQSYPLPKFVSRSVFDSSGTVDSCALSLRPDHLSHLFPFNVKADGNCMPRSLSVWIFGNEDHHVEVRTRIVMELVLNRDRYLSVSDSLDLEMLSVLSDHYSDDIELTFRSEVLDICRLGTYMGMWQLQGASNVFATKILSVYPSRGQECYRRFFNVLLTPSCASPESPIIIFWSSLRNDMIEKYWVANHIVPMMPLVSDVVVETD